MRWANKISVVLFSIFILFALVALANSNDKSTVFQGVINADNINIRTDSTVNSKIICKINKGEPVEVVKELYGWYKIRLPKIAPSYIKKNLVTLLGEKTAQVLEDNVNIRLDASESSWILGRVNMNEVVNILEDKGGWYRIEPVNNSFGWIHKKFIDKVDVLKKIEDVQSIPDIKKEERLISEKPTLENNILTGIIKPYGKVLGRKATHKLITEDNRVFLLKGNKESLDSLNYHRVKITGKLIGAQKYPIVEVTKIEAGIE
jgi:uncharacterized protein YgiM (DUF1202 family)